MFSKSITIATENKGLNVDDTHATCLVYIFFLSIDSSETRKKNMLNIICQTCKHANDKF
jgi:hypothetical protein